MFILVLLCEELLLVSLRCSWRLGSACRAIIPVGSCVYHMFPGGLIAARDENKHWLLHGLIGRTQQNVEWSTEQIWGFTLALQ